MKKKTLQTIRKHSLIERGMHIVIGLSGGPDSVCLFDLLRTLKEELDLTLYAVHVNHKLRPVAAEEDQKYVEALCEEHGISCFSFVVDCMAMADEQNLTSEEAGRKARYEAFGNVAMRIHQSGVPKEKIAIALAHNANDQCETILFRIMRGTGTDGLAGIPYKRFDENGFAIVRPILDLKREEIENYCRERELNPRIDHTNNENIYARNKIRNLLIPYLEENFNENIMETVNRLGQIAAGDRDYLSEEAKKSYRLSLIGDSNTTAFDNPHSNPFDNPHSNPFDNSHSNPFDNPHSNPCGNPCANPCDKPCDEASYKHNDKSGHKQVLDTKVLLGLHSAIRFRVYTIALEKLGMEQNITFAQGELIDKVLVSKRPSAMCDLSDGFVVLKEYDRLVFRQKLTSFDGSNCQDSAGFDEGPNGEYQILTMTRAEFDEFRQAQGKSAEFDEFRQAFMDPQEKPIVYGAFQGVDAKDLCIRTRKPGDVINTGNGTKKIQDFFVDQKVPKHCRDNIRLLARGSRILWVLPSEDFLTESMRQKGRFSADFRLQDTDNDVVLVLKNCD